RDPREEVVGRLRARVGQARRDRQCPGTTLRGVTGEHGVADLAGNAREVLVFQCRGYGGDQVRLQDGAALHERRLLGLTHRLRRVGAEVGQLDEGVERLLRLRRVEGG